MVGLSCNFDAAYAKTTQFIDSNGALVCGHLYVYISCSVHMYVYLYAFTCFHKYKCVYLYAQICIFFASFHMRLPLHVASIFVGLLAYRAHFNTQFGRFSPFVLVSGLWAISGVYMYVKITIYTYMCLYV